MPYKVERHGRQYAVVNTKTGEIKAKSTSKEKAERQARLLRGIEHGWKPTGEKDTYTRTVNGRKTTVRIYASSGKNRLTPVEGGKKSGTE